MSLEKSKAIIFLATSTSVQSQFCQEEIFYAAEMKKSLIPLNLDGTVFQELKKNYKLLHTILSPIQFIEFRNIDEGMAVLLLRLEKVLKKRSNL